MKALLLNDANDATKVLVLFGQGGAVKACVPDEDIKLTELHDVEGNTFHEVMETPEQIFALLTRDLQQGEPLSKTFNSIAKTESTNSNNDFLNKSF